MSQLWVLANNLNVSSICPVLHWRRCCMIWVVRSRSWKRTYRTGFWRCSRWFWCTSRYATPACPKAWLTSLRRQALPTSQRPVMLAASHSHCALLEALSLKVRAKSLTQLNWLVESWLPFENCREKTVPNVHEKFDAVHEGQAIAIDN